MIRCRGFRTQDGKDGRYDFGHLSGRLMIVGLIFGATSTIRFCDGWVRSSDKDGRMLEYPHLAAEEVRNGPIFGLNWPPSA